MLTCSLCLHSCSIPYLASDCPVRHLGLPQSPTHYEHCTKPVNMHKVWPCPGHLTGQATG